MGYSYDNLAGLIGEVVDEAINSIMYLHGFRGSTTEGWTGAGGSGEPVKITAIGGHYEGSEFVQGGQVTDQIHGWPDIVPIHPGYPFRDFPGMIEYFSKTINDLFMDWLMLPDPGRFQGAVDQMYVAAKGLAFNATLKPDPGDDGWGPNGQLASDLNLLDDKITPFNGDAMWTFKKNYTGRLETLVPAQDECASLLYVSARAEQVVWSKARESVAEVAGKAKEAMKEARGGGGAGLDVLFDVVGAVALILAPITGGASEAAEIGLTGVGVLLQTSAGYLPEEHEKKVALGADDPVGVVYNIHEALDGLKKQIRDAEDGISKKLSKATSIVSSQPGSFDLGQPALLFDDDPAHFNELKVAGDVLRKLAGHGGLMSEISGQLDQANKAVVAGSDDGSAWIRPTSITPSSQGPYFEFSSFALMTSGCIGSTATNLDHAAGVLMVVANDFDATDAKIRKDLTAQTDRIGRTPMY